MNKAYSCPDGVFKSFLKEELASYVEFKVNIGKCSPASYLPKLKQFDRYCQQALSAAPDRELIMGFLSLRPGERNTNLYTRTVILCGFLDYMSEVLGKSNVYKPLWKVKKGNYVPYVFSKDEICRLLEAAIKYRTSASSASTSVLPYCMPCIFTMLYCTGMRISEVLALRVSDVDLENRIIRINCAKNNNRRIVTISCSLMKSIRKYMAYSTHFPEKQTYFFHSGSQLHDGQVSIKTAYTYFRRYLAMAGIPHKGRGYGPRLHDIRVTFAVHSLEKLSHLQQDTNALLPVLSSYMGHKSICCTQQYLWLTKELSEDVIFQMGKYVRVKELVEGGASR